MSFPGKPAIFLLAVVLIFAGGCAAPTHLKIKSLPAEPEKRRIVFLTPDVELSILHAGGLNEPSAEWTQSAKKHIGAHLSRKFSSRNIRMVSLEEKEEDIGRDRRESQLRKLHQVLGASVLFHQYEDMLPLPTKAGKFEWSMGPDVKYLKEKYRADYALFIYVRDSYASSGRQAAIFVAALLGVGIHGGIQAGFASLVDLNTGDVVWFNRLFRAMGDLRTAAGADETMNVLLTDMPQ
jgi:hypothetical protein